MRGRVHSIETLGALDGPGLRAVVFLQGCPLRCAFCHNPDTWDPAGGEAWEAAALVRRVLRYRPYFGRRGGLTLSGGEPLLQPAFALALLAGCRAEGVHTALDTSGCLWPEETDAILEATDLVLLDLKAADEATHRRRAGGPLAPVLRFLDRALARKTPVWVRHVVLPGENDTPEAMAALAALLADRAGADSIERIELLPYHTMAAEKYRALGLAPPLPGVPDLPADRIPPLADALHHALGGRIPVVGAEAALPPDPA